MKTKTILAAILLLGTSSVALLASTTSDHEKGVDLSKFRSWDFKDQKRMPRDPLGPNSILPRGHHRPECFAGEPESRARPLEPKAGRQRAF